MRLDGLNPARMDRGGRLNPPVLQGRIDIQASPWGGTGNPTRRASSGDICMSVVCPLLQVSP